MTLSAQLAQEGITLPRAKISASTLMEFQVECPKDYCQTARKGTADKTPLKVEIYAPTYAGWRCRNCLWAGHIGEKPEIEVVPVEKPATAPKASTALPPEAIAFLAGKGIAEEEINRFRLSWDTERRAIKIPYFHGAEVINATFVSVEDGSSRLASSKHILFYGLDKLVPSPDPIIIAQRELDAIILAGRGFENVIALPNGGDIPNKADEYSKEADKYAYLAAASDLVKGWLGVRLVMDDTPEGLAIRQELARRIGPGKCSIITPTKKTVQATIEQLGADVLCEDVHEARPLPIFGLYELDDFEKELVAYFEYGMAAGVNTGWFNVDQLYTVVPGQLTVVTGIPNSGKSEWIDALSINLAMEYGWRFAAFSPENGKEAHATKLIEKRVEMSADPKARSRMSFDTFMSGAQWVKKHYTFIESTDVLPTLDWILERGADAALRHGIKGLVIDPWNRIEKKLGERQSETDYVAAAIPRILRFAVNYGVHVWLVVHPKQQQPDQKTGKIRAPSLYDMAGSAHFVNMCDNGIVIHRSDSVDDATEVHLKKVRFKHVGRRGETKLRYNRNTGRYSPLEDEFKAEDYANKHTAGIKTWEPE